MFAMAFRSMQLESSVFGLCVIQLKPQLEVLLGLPPDSLAKEIKLTQNLLELFMEYQIPSDLLTFSGDNKAPTSEKLAAVQGYVDAGQNMIAEAKEKQLAEAEQEADMRFEMGYEPPPGYPIPLAVDVRSGLHRRLGTAEYGNLSESLVAPMMAMSMSTRGYGMGASPRSFPARQFSAQPMTRSKKLAPSPHSFVSSDVKPPTLPQKEIAYHISGDADDSTTSRGSLDLTNIPKQLDAKFEQLDVDSALRPTIVKAGPVWERQTQKNLLCKAISEKLEEKEQQHEKNKAFDLLDALSRSGSLPIACAEVHAIVGATHCFDLSIMGTAIEENVNPIEKFERSLLIVASTIHGTVDAKALLKNDEQVSRISTHSPLLLTASTALAEEKADAS